MSATKTMKKVYNDIALETKGYFLVGIKPETFFDEFMPWNASTPDPYRQKVPPKRRVAKLRSVPPKEGQVESTMYQPFVEALDKWITSSALRSANVTQPQTLRFVHSLQPDTSCADLNVDVPTYWGRDLPESMDFSRQQTHVQFKRDEGHDAFMHKDDDWSGINKAGAWGEDDEGEDVKAGEDENENENEEDEEEEGENEEEEEEGDEGVDDIPSDDEDLDNDPVPDPDPLEEETLEDCDLGEKRKKIVVPQRYPSWSVETDTELGRQTRGQICAYAGLALSMSFRNHFFSMLVLGQYVRFIRWDRRGAIVTHRSDYTKNPNLVFQFYLRYGQLSPRQRGFDPSVKPYNRPLPRAVHKAFGRHCKSTWHGGGAKFQCSDDPSPSCERFFRITITDPVQKRREAFFIPAPRYTQKRLVPFGRASQRCLACPDIRHATRIDMCFLKDSWQEVSPRGEREADIYRILKQENVPYVASMRLGGDVAGLETETQEWISELSHERRYPRHGMMVCHRIVLDTVARDLSTFTWCKVLLSCIADAVEGAQHAYRAGILHRDLSAGNIMIVKDRRTKEWRGVLIDWDMCLLWKKQVGKRRAERTGTWPFMAARILENPGPVTHTLGDDLESAFWVLVYHSLHYMKHDLCPHGLYRLTESIFASPMYDDGNVTGGRMKSMVIRCCTVLQHSDDTIAKFERVGLNAVLADLAVLLFGRYAKENSPVVVSDADLDDPDEPRFPAVLRNAALKMEPLCITPTGLKSPTNDSSPAENPEERKPASVGDAEIDYVLMPWTSDPWEYYTRVRQQQQQVISVSSSLIHLLDGSTTKKRHHDSEPEDEEEEEAVRPKKRVRVA